MRRQASILRVAGRCGLGLRPLWGAGSAPAAAVTGGGPRALSLSLRCGPATPLASSPLTFRHQAGGLPHWLAGVRCFSSEARKEGTVKMWNEERGFGFITPAGGGEDVFVHRSALREGVLLAPGQIVTFEALWDDKKRKDRAADVAIAAPSEGEGGGGEAPASGQPAARPAGGRPSAYNIVGSFAEWAIHREPMAPDASGGRVRHRITVRSSAPKQGGGDSRREEFQIVGDSSWDKRVYPAGGDQEEVVVLRPGGAASRAASDSGKGHGRNWAVEGRAGTVFDILYDPEAKTVSCEQAFSESQ
mmetsp:Transcript_3094/g.10313  ORF Transcript_3094/g.10313 Transcript_3094/m.10313 type:complete len:303 (-) Transcript_3094:45-953(-)|eukprot:CAMPEP_0204572822 /NCGR_PEP_ID=MMETSP0661-20131031/39674_1 /ASSEMBLY_ACC=CAM_ASM_000606 /TAXON_ID=109239 /ORGANISM="Alexandrium margalefi, Strain AMGDE01CS-322" /LENGTH=302 /DNA_ID=CAMNT_0051581197 /DNA_START=26 /DNA_END=934 /DNA_ORIENTATION=-